jgi:hypothetical protein
MFKAAIPVNAKGITYLLDSPFSERLISYLIMTDLPEPALPVMSKLSLVFSILSIIDF